VLITALAIDPRTPTVIYAGTGLSGVFKSTNGGATFTASNLGLASLQISVLVVDPQTPTTVYAVTFAGGVFKSVNSGASWSASSTGLDTRLVLGLVINPQTPAVLYAGSYYSGVFQSTNGGATWNPVTTVGLTDRGILALAINPSGTCLHAGTGSGVFTFATQASVECLSPPTLSAAIFPTTQLVAVNTVARTFATITNLSSGASSAPEPRLAATGVAGVTCGITQLTGALTPFTFQAIDTTSQPIAPLNTPVDIGPGSNQGFLISLTPGAPICALDIQFGFNCSNADLAPTILGVNTLFLTATGGGQCGSVNTSASLNQATFAAGQTLRITIGGSNPGTAVGADVYIGAFLPDGNTVILLTSTGAFTFGTRTNVGSWQPYRTGLQLQAGFSITVPNFFSYEWTGGEPRGDYVLFLLVMKAGAAAALSGDQVLGRATASFSFH
jgi:hypothetical protein